MMMFDGLTNIARNFWRWWAGELKSLIPAPVKRLFEPTRRVYLFNMSGEAIKLEEWTSGSPAAIASVEPATESPSHLKQKISDIIRSLRLNKKTVGLRVPTKDALTVAFDLPLVPEGELRAVLRHQIDRHTPFSEFDAYFGYEILERRPAENKFKIKLTVVPQKTLEEHLSLFRVWGLEPTFVDVGHGQPAASSSKNLLIDAQANSGRKKWAKINTFLFFLLVVLLGTAVFVPLDNRRALTEEAVRKASQLGASSAEVLALRNQIDDLQKDAAFLAQKRNENPRAMAVLKELTEIFEDDIWIFHFEITGSEVRISGYASAASSLIQTIDGSAMFRNPRFRSPVVRPRDSEKERFNISFEIES